MTRTEEAIANLRFWTEVVAYRLEAADEMVKRAQAEARHDES